MPASASYHTVSKRSRSCEEIIPGSRLCGSIKSCTSSQRGSHSRLPDAKPSASRHGGPKSCGSSAQLRVRREDRWAYDVAFWGTTGVIRMLRKRLSVSTPYLNVVVHAATFFLEVNPKAPENTQGTWTRSDSCTDFFKF
jgi:hypothetical protein